jgi:hypothetical protein
MAVTTGWRSVIEIRTVPGHRRVTSTEATIGTALTRVRIEPVDTFIIGVPRDNPAA